MSFSWAKVLSMVSAGLGAAALAFPVAAPFLIGGAAVVGAVSAGIAHGAGKQAIATQAVVTAAQSFVAANPNHQATTIVKGLLAASGDDDTTVAA